MHWPHVHIGTVNWTAVGAIGTFAAVCVALGFGWFDRRRAAMAQAMAVFAVGHWMDGLGERIQISNGSASAIFRVAVVAVDELSTREGKLRWKGATEEPAFARIAPQSADSLDLRWEGGATVRNVAELDRVDITIEFTDAGSVRWRRRGSDRPRRVRRSKSRRKPWSGRERRDPNHPNNRPPAEGVG